MKLDLQVLGTEIAELRHTLGSTTAAKEGLQKQVSLKDETIKVRTLVLYISLKQSTKESPLKHKLKQYI